MLLPDRRWLLRSSTEAIHKKLDETVGNFSTRDGYARYLRGMFGFRAYVEVQLSPTALPDEFGSFRPTRLIEELVRDMAAMGTPVRTESDSARGEIRGLPLTRDAVFGVLYVLEGSALGARILVRRCAELGVCEATGAAHLVKQSASLGNWNAFCALLAEAEDIDDDAMVDAALATFSCAVSAFEKA